LRVPEIDSEGRIAARERLLNVRVPKGILAGQTIRLAGQGAPPLGGGQGEAKGKPGDLYIEVEFQPHPLYRVEGRDLYVDLPVAPWEAALGAAVKTPTPGGVVDLKVPAGAQAGTKLRLRGRGIPASPPGDLYAVLQIAVPKPTDDKGKAAYRALADAMPFNPRANLGV
jgi:curved DNA-binding protein